MDEISSSDEEHDIIEEEKEESDNSGHQPVQKPGTDNNLGNQHTHNDSIHSCNGEEDNEDGNQLLDSAFKPLDRNSQMQKRINPSGPLDFDMAMRDS